ncbi:MAG: FAD:protein FMN transferase [Halieaceae bacterium]
MVKAIWTLLGRPAIALAFLLLVVGCNENSPTEKLSGSIFGTSWNLTYLDAPEGVTRDQVEAAAVGAFAVVDDSMNNYRPDSTISRLNALDAMNAFEVDWDFALVFNTAFDIYAATDGAYDPSVSPLVNLWGFGPKAVVNRPSREAIDALAPIVGLEEFAWDLSTRAFVKKHAKAELDFSSIAKGYAVDLASDALIDLGVTNFMLEVGGEVQTRGMSPRGDRWRLAIENPVAGAAGGVYTAISVTDVGVATSGDYRNFFIENGVRYSHLIDPRTSQPIEHDLVSVTVVHPSTMIADAWATALMVVGTDEALRLADIYDLGVLLISREGQQLVSSNNELMSQWLMASDKEGGTQ